MSYLELKRERVIKRHEQSNFRKLLGIGPPSFDVVVEKAYGIYKTDSESDLQDVLSYFGYQSRAHSDLIFSSCRYGFWPVKNRQYRNPFTIRYQPG